MTSDPHNGNEQPDPMAEVRETLAALTSVVGKLSKNLEQWAPPQASTNRAPSLAPAAEALPPSAEEEARLREEQTAPAASADPQREEMYNVLEARYEAGEDLTADELSFLLDNNDDAYARLTSESSGTSSQEPEEPAEEARAQDEAVEEIGEPQAQSPANQEVAPVVGAPTATEAPTEDAPYASYFMDDQQGSSETPAPSQENPELYDDVEPAPASFDPYAGADQTTGPSEPQSYAEAEPLPSDSEGDPSSYTPVSEQPAESPSAYDPYAGAQPGTAVEDQQSEQGSYDPYQGAEQGSYDPYTTVEDQPSDQGVYDPYQGAEQTVGQDPYAAQQPAEQGSYDPYQGQGVEQPAEQGSYDPYQGQGVEQPAEQHAYDPYQGAEQPAEQGSYDPYANHQSSDQGSYDPYQGVGQPVDQGTYDPYQGAEQPAEQSGYDPYEVQQGSEQPGYDPYVAPQPSVEQDSYDPYQGVEQPAEQGAYDPYQGVDQSAEQGGYDPYEAQQDPEQPGYDPYTAPQPGVEQDNYDPYAAQQQQQQGFEQPVEQGSYDPYQGVEQPAEQDSYDPYAAQHQGFEQPVEQGGYDPYAPAANQLETSSPMEAYNPYAGPPAAAAAPVYQQPVQPVGQTVPMVDVLLAIAKANPVADRNEHEAARMGALRDQAEQAVAPVASKKGGKKSKVKLEELPLGNLSRALIITVASAKGGVGKSTTSVQLGAYIAAVGLVQAERAGKGPEDAIKVLIFDGDVANGNLAIRVSKKTRPNLVDLARHMDRYQGAPHTFENQGPAEEDRGIASFMIRHSALSNLHILAAPEEPEWFDAFRDEDYHQILNMLGRFYNVIIIDSGTEHALPFNRIWLRHADVVFLLTQPEVAALHSTARQAQRIRRSMQDRDGNPIPALVSQDRIFPVMMRANAELGIDPETAMQSMFGDIEESHCFYFDDFDRETARANNRGQFITLENPGYAKNLSRLVTAAFSAYNNSGRR